MGLFLKSDSEIESIIQQNQGEKLPLIRVSRTKEKDIGYYSSPNKNDYESISEYIKTKVEFIRSHYYGEGHYFGTQEYQDEITHNYSNLSQKHTGKEGVIVKGTLTKNRHLQISDAIRCDIIGKVFHNTPPFTLKLLLIKYLVKKYELDSYEVGGLREIEVFIWEKVHNILAKKDGNYIIVRDINNLEKEK